MRFLASVKAKAPDYQTRRVAKSWGFLVCRFPSLDSSCSQ
jgi:hypothetical protein